MKLHEVASGCIVFRSGTVESLPQENGQAASVNKLLQCQGTEKSRESVGVQAGPRQRSIMWGRTLEVMGSNLAVLL